MYNYNIELRITRRTALVGAVVLGVLALFAFRDFVLGFFPNEDAIRRTIGGRIDRTVRALTNVGEWPYLLYRLRGHELPVYDIEVSASNLRDLDEHFSATASDLGREKIYRNATFWTSEDRDARYEVAITYRGDQETHVTGDQKSWRVRFRGDNLFGGQKEVDLILPQGRLYLLEELNNYRARKLGLIVPESRFVVLRVNGRTIGVYWAAEHWSEELLEKHINDTDAALYGEDGFGSEFLYEDAAAWQTYTGETKGEIPDRSALAALLSLIGEPSDTQFYHEIGGILDLDTLYRWQSAAALSGSASADKFHNVRLYFDPALGRLVFVPWHIVGSRLDTLTRIDSFTFASNPLLRRLFMNPAFLYERNRVLWEYVRDESNFVDDLAYYDRLFADTRIAFFRDTLKPFSNAEFVSEVKRWREALEHNFHYLHDSLADTDVSLRAAYGLPRSKNTLTGEPIAAAFTFRLASASPIDLTSFRVRPAAALVSVSAARLYDDTNESGALDWGDRLVTEFHADSNDGTLLARDLSLRLWSRVGEVGLRDGSSVLDIVPREHTVFVLGSGLVVGESEDAIRVVATNAVSGATTTIGADFLTRPGAFDLNAVGRTVYDFARMYPQFRVSGPQALTLGPGTVVLDKTLIVPQDLVLTIAPGTNLYLGADVSLVSYSQIRAEGSNRAPIRFLPLGRAAWGTVAVIGARGESVFSHTLFEHQQTRPQAADPDGHALATEAINGIIFRGMLSLFHSDFRIESSEFRHAAGDDALNAKFAQGSVRGSRFYANSSDGLDFDAVSGTVSGCLFAENGNDGIDVSGSELVIRDTRIVGSRDRGISIGERSAVRVFNTLVLGGNDGIAVKDSSEAAIVNTTIVGTKRGIALENKKPTFGGGTAKIANVLIAESETSLFEDARSHVTVSHSRLDGDFAGEALTSELPVFEHRARGNYLLSPESPAALREGGDRAQAAAFDTEISGSVPIGILSEPAL